ncbi:MAG: ribosomal protein S18-alanine N-acetyltransferase [Deltaproteobacteria bacterium]|nr:ribosomal protein S18-alanine N-acetyltransferase [Deltaproteobacteria bacterium]
MVLPEKATIREMGPADLDGVMAIEAVSFPTPWSRRLFVEEIGRVFSDALVAVRESDGSVLGYAVCWTVAGESHLLNIAVHPDARGRGLGRALLRECLRRGASAGATRIHLEVRPGNREALGLYRKEGFRLIGIRRGYYTDTGEDALILARELGKDDIA